MRAAKIALVNQRRVAYWPKRARRCGRLSAPGLARPRSPGCGRVRGGGGAPEAVPAFGSAVAALARRATSTHSPALRQDGPGGAVR